MTCTRSMTPQASFLRIVSACAPYRIKSGPRSEDAPDANDRRKVNAARSRNVKHDCVSKMTSETRRKTEISVRICGNEFGA